MTSNYVMLTIGRAFFDGASEDLRSRRGKGREEEEAMEEKKQVVYIPLASLLPLL